MSGPFNQKVDKEMVAGPQPDVPLDGGGGGAAAAASRPRPRPVRLSALGLGTNVPKPAMEQPQEQQQESSAAGPRGPRAPYRPVGRDDKNLQHGNQNLLNAIESEFYSFFARMEDPIIRNWYFLLRAHDMQMHQEMAGRGVKPGADLPVTVEFVLDRQGNFQSMTVIESSGIPTLDWATKESVRKLGSLPNPPPALFEGSQYFTHRLRFMVHVTDTPVFTTRPDLYY